jgi:hypothetical protein
MAVLDRHPRWNGSVNDVMLGQAEMNGKGKF